jgi:glyoxylase-like metal-dependent hydrolase (beta-lactamase superfamily II)
MMIRDQQGYTTIPVSAWLIIHSKGVVLFDSGFHSDVVNPHSERLGHLSKILDIHLKPSNNIVKQLELCQVDVNDVQFLINSHLHTDHCGGNIYVKNATMVLQKREDLAGRDSGIIKRSGYFPQDYHLGHPKMLISGEHDFFGDGRIILVPTYGHTHGHQSLLLRLDNGKQVLLCVDACYFKETLDRMILPGKCFNEKEFMSSLMYIKRLYQKGVQLYYGHDPVAWSSYPKAPNPLY